MDTLKINNLKVRVSRENGRPGGNFREKFLLSAVIDLKPRDDRQRDGFEEPVDPVKIGKDLAETIAGLDPGPLEQTAEKLAFHILLKHPVVNRIELSLTRLRGRTEFRAQRQRHTAYLGIGTNLGDRIENIRSAQKFINDSEYTRVTNTSRIYETEPQGYLDQGLFLNGVLEIETLLSPRELIRFLLSIEDRLKRERIIPLGPRTIDLDILFYDSLVTSFKEAVIPHPRLHERMFVLKPLCDIAPFYVHPLLNQRCYRILEELAAVEKEPAEWT